MKQWEPQLCFKNGTAALSQYTKTRYCHATENGAATRKHNRAIAFLIKNDRPCLPTQGIEALWVDQNGIASSPKLLSPRYVVYGHVAIVFGIGRSVMKGITCCNTVSESPTTRGVESDEKAST